jgi:hypothetical protein
MANKQTLIEWDVQVSKAGGFFKARFAGRTNFVFGATSAQAVERLLLSAKSKRWGLVPVPTSDELLEAYR